MDVSGEKKTKPQTSKYQSNLKIKTTLIARLLAYLFTKLTTERHFSKPQFFGISPHEGLQINNHLQLTTIVTLLSQFFSAKSEIQQKHVQLDRPVL